MFNWFRETFTDEKKEPQSPTKSSSSDDEVKSIDEVEGELAKFGEKMYFNFNEGSEESIAIANEKYSFSFFPYKVLGSLWDLLVRSLHTKKEADCVWTLPS